MSDTAQDLLGSDIGRVVQASFDRQGLMRSFGARLARLSPGRCEIAAPITPETSQQHGAAHAGLTFALGDSAAGYAALTVMEPGAEVMTAEMKINLLSPATGRTLIARGRVARAGKRLVVVTAEVAAQAEDGSLRVVALMQGTMVPVSAPPEPTPPADPA